MAVVELLVLARDARAPAAAARRCARRGPGCARRACPRRGRSASSAAAPRRASPTISTGSQAFQRCQTVQSISPVSRSNGSATPCVAPRLGRIGARLRQHHDRREVGAVLLLASPRSGAGSRRRRRGGAASAPRREGRAARDSSKYMSPAWLATAENRSGWRIASTSAPNPPDDLPPMARASRAATVRKRASIAGSPRARRASRSLPIAGESRYCAPPQRVKQSGATTIASPIAPRRDQPIEPVAQARLPRRSREQHLARARVARQPVDHRVAARRARRVRRRQPDGDPPRRRVAQRVAGERAAFDDLDDGAHRDRHGAGQPATATASRRRSVRPRVVRSACGRSGARGCAGPRDLDRCLRALDPLAVGDGRPRRRPPWTRAREDPAEPGGRVRTGRSFLRRAASLALRARRRRCGSTTSGRRPPATPRYAHPRRPADRHHEQLRARADRLLPAGSRTTGSRSAARSPRGGCRRPSPDSPPPSASRPVGSATTLRLRAARHQAVRAGAAGRAAPPASSRTSASPAIAPRLREHRRDVGRADGSRPGCRARTRRRPCCRRIRIW